MNRKLPEEQDRFNKLDSTFTTLDQQRAQGLEQLKTMQVMHNTALEQEQKRLSAKYGEDHPRVQAAASRLTYNQGLFRDLDGEIGRSQISIPSVDANTWLAHGFVLDGKGVGIEGLTISFFDGQNQWIRGIGYACTDRRGYFAISYKTEQPDDQPLFLNVADKNQRSLYRDPNPRVVKLGLIDFWQIVLSDSAADCPPPVSDPPPPQPIEGVVSGRVIDPNQQGLPKLTVTAFNAAMVGIPRIGSTLTGDKGEFKIVYPRTISPDGREVGPDLFIAVTSDAGTVLFSSRDAVRSNAKREEDYGEIVITRLLDR
jgi:hypothetical protein